MSIRSYPDNPDNQNNLKIYHPDQIIPRNPGYELIEGKEREAEYGGTEADDNDIKSLLYEWIGAVDHFSDGKMYYAVPIMHNAVKHKDDANQKTLGDYGVVRNHFYTFELNNVNGIGIPVDDPDEPIVPDHSNINDVINMKIYMLPWHVVNTTAPVFP